MQLFVTSHSQSCHFTLRSSDEMMTEERGSERGLEGRGSRSGMSRSSCVRFCQRGGEGGDGGRVKVQLGKCDSEVF